MGLEASQLRPFEKRAAAQADAERIDRCTVAMDFIMKVRAGGESGGADIADQLALSHEAAGFRDQAAHVAVGGNDAAIMGDPYLPSVAAQTGWMQTAPASRSRRWHGRWPAG